ncbi:hypothetical protein KR018_006383 [Drosophila ironensis]|nr:hypothetical protein KR018_006383 [Drosophila ironensis]
MQSNYLMEFGYLPKSKIASLRTGEQMKDAIRSLQAFGNIPVTGEIDAKTNWLIRQPRCGVGDHVAKPRHSSPDNLDDNGGSRVRRFVLQGPKWDKTDLTWSLVNRTMPDAPKIQEMVRRALDVWEKNSKLTFRQKYSDQSDIQILFARRQHGDGYQFDGPGQVLAHAFYPGEGRGGDAHFDADETWNFDGKSDFSRGTNFLNVALHELGHSLGLGHSSDANAVMFPWYQDNEVDGTLPDDDRNGIQQLYGSKEKTWGRLYPNKTPATTTTTTTTTTMRTLTYYPQNAPRNPAYDRDRQEQEREWERAKRKRERERMERERAEWEQEERQREERQRRLEERRLEERRLEERRLEERRLEERRRKLAKQQEEEERQERERERQRNWDRQRTTTTTMRAVTMRTTTSTRSRPYPNGGHRHNRHHKPGKPKPDGCMINYDAISMIRGELFIFRGQVGSLDCIPGNPYKSHSLQFLWRFGEKGLYAAYPTETRRHWAALPENFTKVDAVYENKRRQIVFFIGRQYYVFNSDNLAPGYPKPLASLGLPPTLTHIDAAFVWGHNNRTFLTSGTLYWRMDDFTGQVDPVDYPRDMSIWSGVGYNIDAAFQYTDGKTYFFKNLGYWEFNDDKMRVAHARPKLSSRKWMQCHRSDNEVDDEHWTAPLVSGETEDEDTPRGRSNATPLPLKISLHLVCHLTILYAAMRS